MRQLAVTARNLRHCIVEGEAVPLIEAVITLIGKEMAFSGTSIVHQETLETIRFEMGIEGARQFRDSIDGWIKDAEAEGALLTVEEHV